MLEEGKRRKMWLELRGYALAVAAVAAATVLRGVLARGVGPGLPTYITFYPAVMVAGLLGGLGPGLVATFATGLVVSYWVLSPVGSSGIEGAVNIAGFVFFSAMGVFMSAVAESYRRSRQRAAAVLAAERQRLYDVLETMPAMVCLLTPDYHVAFSNRAFRQRFGEGGGRHCYEYCFGRSRPCEFCESYNVLKTGRPHHWEVKAPDGSIIAAHDFPFTNADGTPMILEMDIDITEMRRAQAVLKQANDELEQGVAERTAQLKASEERLRLFIEHAPAALAMFDREMRYVSVSQRWLDDYGLAGQNLLGRSHYEVFPEISERWKGFHRRCLAGEVLREEAERFERADGSVQWLRWEVRPWHDVQGAIGGIVIFSEDITERKQAEAAVRESQEQFHALADSIPNLAWWANGDGYITWYNRRWYEYTGTTAQQMEGWGWQSVHDPELLPKVLERWKESIATGEPFDMEFPLRGADGQFRIFLTRVQPLKDGLGRVVRWFGTNTDVNELKRAEQERETTIEFLRLVNTSASLGGLIEAATSFFREQTGCEAVGVRLCEGDGQRGARNCWQGEGCQPVALLPLRVGEERLGLVQLSDRRPDRFSAETIGAWERLADHLAVAVSRFRAEEALQENQARLRLALKSAKMGTFEWDIAGNKRRWDDHVHALLGTDPKTFSGTAEELLSIIHPADREAAQAALERAIQAGLDYDTEYRVVWPDGSVHHIAARGRVTTEPAGRPVHLLGVCWDITERKRAEEELQKLNRTLRALGKSNEALMRTRVESEYLEEVCKIVAEDCGHAMVWVGYAEEDEAKTVRPVAHAGFEEGYLGTLRVAWAETERGRGPTGTAIRTGKPCGCGNMQSDPRFEPWRQEAFKRGYASSMAIPLLANGKAFGALTIYSREPAAFSKGELRLLTELADDMVAGITTIRARLAEERAREQLKLSLREKEVLLKEIHHRVKNNLQVIASLVDLQTDALSDPAQGALFQDVRDRVRTMAMVHEKLYQSESLARLNLAGYTSSLVGYLARAHVKPETNVEVKCDMEPVWLSIEKAVPFGLMLNELVTNALKHAFKGRATGEVTVGLRAGPGGQVCLRVSDNGAGLPAGMDWRRSPSLGLQLVGLLAKQVRASVEVGTEGGTEFKITFKAERAGKRGE